MYKYVSDMTAEELLSKAEDLINRAKELLAQEEDSSESTNAANDTLAAWREHIVTVNAFYIMDDDEVSSTDGPYPRYIEDFNPYGTYPTEEYALMAQKMKIFNDKLLAFKWCYDRDYQPDWEETSEHKYVVLFNPSESRFVVGYFVSRIVNIVYFGTKDIAQKCADWLNSLDEKES